MQSYSDTDLLGSHTKEYPPSLKYFDDTVNALSDIGEKTNNQNQTVLYMQAY